MFEPAFIDHLLFVLFGLLIPANSVLRSQPQLVDVQHWDISLKKALYRGNSLLLWGIATAVVLVWLFMGRPLAELGFRFPAPGTWTSGLLISGVFLLAYGLDVWSEISNPEALERTRRHWIRHTPFMPENRQEARYFMLVAVSAAICEEILFRGYLITYLLALLGNSFTDKTLALLIPTLIFAVSHFYQGWKAVAKIGLLSLAFGLIFLITKSLLLPVLLHLFVDVLGGLLSLHILGDSNGTEFASGETDNLLEEE